MDSQQTPILTIKSLGKSFENTGQDMATAVINDISLDAGMGEIISIVGPSGCGKSTLLGVLAGFDKDYSGEVLYEKLPISGPSPERGMVFQTPALFDWLSVRDNIGYGLKIKKAAREAIDSEVDKYISLIGLEGFENFYPSQLSGGMQQRVALARALIMNPSLLLMDEPFSALDYQSRLEMQNLMLRLWEVHRPTILLVTHDVEESILVADRIIVMSKRPGSILREFKVPFGRPRDISLMKNPEFNNLKADILGLLFDKDKTK